jgi:hypothetical protein
VWSPVAASSSSPSLSKVYRAILASVPSLSSPVQQSLSHLPPHFLSTLALQLATLSLAILSSHHGATVQCTRIGAVRLVTNCRDELRDQARASPATPSPSPLHSSLPTPLRLPLPDDVTGGVVVVVWSVCCMPRLCSYHSSDQSVVHHPTSPVDLLTRFKR